VSNITTYKDSQYLFISINFRVEVIVKEPMLDSVAEDPMLEWASYQDVRVDTCWSLLRSRDLLQPIQGFSLRISFPQPLLSSFFTSFQLGAAEW
jgi:hypothetical protein